MYNLNDYQKEALSFAVYPEGIIYPVLGLTGEAGEVAEKVKKILRDKNGVVSDTDKQEIAKEVGDVFWYVSVLAKELGMTLNEIAELNIQKLTSRKERGKLGGSGDSR